MPKYKLGQIAFMGIIGISILSGLGVLTAINALATTLLIVAGIIVGLKNVKKSETTKFIVSMLALTAGVGVVAFSVLGTTIATTIGAIFDSLLIGFGTATLAAGLRAVYNITINK